MRRRAEARSEAIRQRRITYVALVEAANGVLMLGQTLRAVLLAQSGLAGSAAQLLRLRKPVDPFELAWRMADEVKPILDAQAGVLACGTPRAAAATAQVVTTASEYLRAATAMTSLQRRLVGITPWTPTREQEEVLATRLSAAGLAVREFVAIMREDLGEHAFTVVPKGGEDPRRTL
ncbi:MAG: hypothetical protein HGA44_09420 [Cellulomonadaceae bacterium]|nr:hypothetical protein [Cellulomonadaceae bacterium]